MDEPAIVTAGVFGARPMQRNHPCLRLHENGKIAAPNNSLSQGEGCRPVFDGAVLESSQHTH